MYRRKFITEISGLGIGLLIWPTAGSGWGHVKNQFTLCLNPGAIGHSMTFNELLKAADQYQFNAIVPPLKEILTWDNRKTVLELDRMQQLDVSWGTASLPIEFRKDRTTFEEGLEYLIENVLRLEGANIAKMSTWIMPTHADLDYNSNMELHVKRLGQVADVLRDHGIQLGLEYVGPKTLRESEKYPFISNMKEAKELISNINRSNVGLQLDAFHWYCAGETKEDILSLNSADIVTVDLNDAVANRSRAEQLDWERELPGATGVVDLKSFLSALKEIGYNGPMRAEPFNQKLNELDTKTALRKTSDAMHKAVAFLDN